MFFSQTAEYALRAAVFLADHEGEPQVTQRIAEVTRVPAGYLSKVLQALGRAGVVSGQRGVGGGFTLARAPADLTVLDVVNAVDPIRRIRECPLGLQAHGVNLCPLHHKLDEAIAMIERAFGETTLADLLHVPGRVKPLCDIQTPGNAAKRSR